MAQRQKIAFDCSGHDYDEGRWDEICHEISRVFEDAGLPSLYSDAWEESDGSCVFEGSPEEVERIHQILSGFTITVTK